MNRVDAISAFERAMIDAGITPDFRDGQGVTDDGVLIRFHVAGDSKGTRNGWAVLFGDGIPAGEFGSWKSGASHTWCARDRSELTPHEQAAINAKIEEARARRESERKAKEGEAAKLANLLWQGAVPADDSHPYLVRKGIACHKLRTAPWPVRNRHGEVFRHIENTLLIPIMDSAGRITSLQGIFPAVDTAFGRDKDFLIGGRKRGCFYMIGSPPAGAGTVAFAEGYATACSIHDATGWCVVVCWDAYNVPHVAKALREAMPQSVFVFTADNDQWTGPTAENPKAVDNPGITYAKRAAADVGGRVVWPEFSSLDGRPTDFNDLHEREGLDVVQSQIMPPPPAPAAAPPVTMPPADKAPADKAPAGYFNPIDPLSVDLHTPFPDFDGKGKPLPTPTNLHEMLRRIRANVRYNVISKDVEVILPGMSSSIDNEANASAAELLGWCARFRMSTANFDGNLVRCADANPYNPVATWIGSTPWDGESRLQAFFNTVQARFDTTLKDGRSLKEVLMRKWLVSAVAAAFSRDGVVARGVLTFQSKQNLGKTYWLKRLAPRDLGVIDDGLILDPHNKDSVKMCVSKWIVELGEVDATFRRSDMAALKAFISKDRDELRRPYARSESRYARRTVFFASVNPERFLRDETGNTRWWTINVESLDNAHTIDMQQLWAEVKSLYDAGETWHLTPDELAGLDSHNSNSEEINPTHEMVDREFAWDSAPTTWLDPMRATEIARACGIDKPTKKDVNEVAAYVTNHYGVQTGKVGRDRSKVWFMPSRIRGGYGRPDESPL